jgi:flagellar basal body-associated protein FliL
MYRQTKKRKKQMFRKVTLFLMVVVALVLGVMPVLAQTRTVTITEQQINESYRVTNPRRATVSNRVVDLQNGQVVISYTLTYRNNTSIEVVSTYTASVSNGRINWTMTSLTGNGEPASQDLIAQINTSISTSWRNFVRGRQGTGRVQSIVITDNDIQITFARR